MTNSDRIEKLKRFDAGALSDALDRLGISGGLLNIQAVVPGNVICGPAFTVKYIPCGQEKGTVGDYLDSVQKGDVVVIDNDGRLDCTVWGDIMSLYATLKEVEGTIIDGVCRDLPDIKKLNYPIFTKGHYMVTGKERVEVAYVNQPVTISNIQVRPGDIIFGDDTGVLAIPYNRLEEVLTAAEEIEKVEHQIREALKQGMTLKEAREKLGYHTLQSRQIVQEEIHD